MSAPDPSPSFPPEFLFGAASSAHQVEGGNHGNDWWEAESSGRLPHASGKACGHYERYEEDFELARSIGHTAHRFSIEWSRIEPEAGRFDGEAIEHYRAVIAALHERGLEPIVTLHHFTNPTWFTAEGGWENADAPRRFADYVSVVARDLGDDVRLWVTLNEPTVLAQHGWLLGEWPPFERGSWMRANRVLTNLARAHVAAFRALRQQQPGAAVGLAHSAPHVVPCDPTNRKDRLAARLRDRALNVELFRRIGARPGRPQHLDFIGINYYTRTLVSTKDALMGRACKDAHHADLGPLTQTGWEVHATGLTSVLERFAGYGVPLYVTENGVATEDELLRRQYLRDHLESVAAALARGVDVRGYLWWSLYDNYEWALGYRPRFGLCSTHRVPRPAAWDLEAVCRTRSVGAVAAEASVR
jgi:beta-glucosidase